MRVIKKNMNVDIFAQGKSLNPNIEFKWVGFTSIGDKYQGVYIGIVKSKDGYGNPQTTYLIEQEDKSVLGVAKKDSNTHFHELMKNVKIGQYVGFMYSKDLDVGKPNKAKIIEIITDPNLVNPEWVGKTGINTSTVENIDEEPISPSTGSVSATPAQGFNNQTIFGDEQTGATSLSVPEKIKKITNLAKEKLSANGPEDVKAKVEETTGLVINPKNLDEIISVLELV